MGFSFGFTEEDLNSEEAGITSQNNKQNAIETSINPIDSAKVVTPPQLHSSKQLSQKLINTRISFESVSLANGSTLYRRELFDVKHQLMAEDEQTIGNTKTQQQSQPQQKGQEFDILIGDTDEDLRQGVYEGGLKSWECSFDLIDKLDRGTIQSLSNQQQSFDLIELGCGTALPSLYIFNQLIESLSKQSSNENESKRRINIVLTDYNYEVLRLVTLPNVLINWCLHAITPQQLVQLQGRYTTTTTEREETITAKQRKDYSNVRPGEIDITLELIDAFNTWLDQNGIMLSFVSGSWCRDFMNLVQPLLTTTSESLRLVLTSETIYSLDISPVISEILLELVRPETDASGVYVDAVALLAAKDIYFGVGGSISEFLSYLNKRNDQVTQIGDSGYNWEVEKVKNSHLKRSIVTLKKA
ncbi:unnamed protein product [Ambrosiozyma monospora]|uniref:protein-histidine N-methyltransferase n=1 Tax=Ambrosiozyma monospora TaxID=43982 RepID=A0A9W7DBL0_AMBMO|nr:unnamed protein product [Ambrosiozyma monospora]